MGKAFWSVFVVLVMACGGEDAAVAPTDAGADTDPTADCEWKAFGDPCGSSGWWDWEREDGKVIRLFCARSTVTSGTCAPRCVSADQPHEVTHGECGAMGGECRLAPLDGDLGELCVPAGG